MRSKNLIYLFIMFFVAVAIVFLGGYENVKAQTWTSLPPYNFLSPALTFPQAYDFSNFYTPLIAPLTTVPDLTRSAMVPPTPVGGVPGWFQEINTRMPMAISPSFTMDFSQSVLDLQPGLPETMEYNDSYGASFLHEWGEMSWNPYAYPGRFLPSRIKSTLYEFSTQIPHQELFPTPDKWRPSGGRNPGPGGGDWGGFTAIGGSGGGWTTSGYAPPGGGWTSMGGLGPSGGGWMGYGINSGLSGIGGQ